MLLTFSGRIEAVDGSERRVISGMIAPYGEIGNTSAGKVVFSPGSISAADTNKVKLLMSHDSSKPVGRMMSMQSNNEGLYASFRISESTRGNDAILLAQEKLMDGLSVGVEVIASKPVDDYLLVTAAKLREVSLVETAAFTSAAVQKIAAQAEAVAQLEAMTSTKTVHTVIHTIETETESEEAVTTAPEPTETPVEATAAQSVEAARAIIRPSVMNSQSVRSPIKTNADYLHHVIQAKLNPSSESALYIAAADASKTGFILNAADDSFTTNPAFSPTQFMPNVVQVNIGERPVIDACGGTRAIPAAGMTISIPKITTNGTVATTAEGAGPSETGITSAYVSGTVVKLAGSQKWSVELMDRGDPSFAAILMDNMTRSYRKATEQATIAAIVAGGTQATGTAATAAGITSFISTESAAAYLATGETVAAYTAGVGQWSLLQSSLDTTGRPIFSAGQPMNSGGSALATTLFGNVQGIPLSVSANMVSTVIDESAFLIVPSAIELFESSQLMLSVNIPASGEIEAMIYGYFCPIVTLAGGLRRFNLT